MDKNAKSKEQQQAAERKDVHGTIMNVSETSELKQEKND